MRDEISIRASRTFCPRPQTAHLGLAESLQALSGQEQTGADHPEHRGGLQGHTGFGVRRLWAQTMPVRGRRRWAWAPPTYFLPGQMWSPHWAKAGQQVSRIKLGSTSYKRLPVLLRGAPEAAGLAIFKVSVLISGKKLIRILKGDPKTSAQVLCRIPSRGWPTRERGCLPAVPGGGSNTLLLYPDASSGTRYQR